MKNIIIAAAFCLLFFTISCDDNSVQPNAIEMSLNSLSELPGYDWIGSVMATYQPDTTIFNEIKPLLDSNSQYFIFFVKSCGPCASASQQFAEIIKILRMCNFPENRYEILVMNSISNNHPYQNIIHINSLPTIMLLKNNVPIYSLSDTLAKSIEKQLQYPVRSEELLYEALKVANQ
ncbi:MAG TPA: hypothetical protein P5545_07045 [Bacteroidota bacterium]|nr:hypothetical protein [Bacteroidota bacterium]